MTQVQDSARCDGRRPDELRPLGFSRGFTKYAEGSVLVSAGDTRVLCTATVTPGVPRFLTGKGEGWVTAEYGLLPRSTGTPRLAAHIRHAITCPSRSATV